MSLPQPKEVLWQSKGGAVFLVGQKGNDLVWMVQRDGEHYKRGRNGLVHAVSVDAMFGGLDWEPFKGDAAPILALFE